MEKFREYLKETEEALMDRIKRLDSLYQEGIIPQNYYTSEYEAVSSQVILLSQVTNKYEFTHKIWE